MTDELCNIIRTASQISVQNTVVPATGAKESVVPCHSTDPTIVTFKRLDYLRLSCIPNLKVSSVSANCEMVTVTRPLDTCDPVIRTNVTQFSNFTVSRRPQINARSESNSKNILLGPVNKV